MEGRYYFSPPGTPWYPGPHNLWSRDWVSDDGYEKAALGEWDGPRKDTGWDRGDLPTVVPLPVLVGSAECIRDGEDIANAPRPPRCSDDSCLLPLQCYADTNAFEKRTNVWDCKFGYHCARIVETVQSDLHAAETMAVTLLGESTETFEIPSSGTYFPPALIAKHGTHFFAFLAGTENIFQLMMQVIQGVVQPRPQGVYSTLDLYEFAANSLINELMDAGAGDATRIVLIGHSYGGAYAQTIAAKIKAGASGKRTELMTFGAPRAGDQRLQDLIAAYKQIHYCVHNDPVPWVPTREPYLISLIPGLISDFPDLFRRYARPKKIALISPEDTIELSSQASLEFDTLATMYKMAASIITTQPFDEHFMVNYSNKLRKACPFIDDDCDLFPIAHREIGENSSFRVTLTDVQRDDAPVPTPITVERDVVQTGFGPYRWTGTAGAYTVVIESPESPPDDPNPATCTLQVVIVGLPDPLEVRFDLPFYWWQGCEGDNPEVTNLTPPAEFSIGGFAIEWLDP